MSCGVIRDIVSGFSEGIFSRDITKCFFSDYTLYM